MDWTGATPAEVLATLQGASPASRAGAVETARIAAAIAVDPTLCAIVEADRPPIDIIAALRADRGDVGRLVAEYLELHGLRPITGMDVVHLRFLDMPELFVRGVRAALAGAAAPPDRAADAFAAIRARTPEARRAELDDAYAEARLAYSVRDDDVGITLWSIGIVHRAVIEAGRRLAACGAVEDAAHAYEANPEEMGALLRSGASSGAVPSASELRTRHERRLELDAIDAPFVLGEAGPMPALDCFPPAVARMQRATMAFLASMEGERVATAPCVRGTPVSAGVYEGRARIVRGSDDFARIERGDVLVARFTSPAYNVVLPLLGAIVTERGGLLSHAAIVAREYGIPAIVNTHDALDRIPDGAIVRVDGATGDVTVVRTADSTVRGSDSTVRGSDSTVRASDSSVRGSDGNVREADVHVASSSGRVVGLVAASAVEFGGKAKALSAAVAAKLPVPDGIALDADLVARVVAGEPEARARVTAALAGVPAPWAVRSSAVGEDSAQASFAGQHATVLGVEAAALFEAIGSVHASGHTEAARAYRQRMGVSGAPRMGVVVQTLLRPDISGVLFSRDPSAAREGRVIEATWGLGEALVAGLVTPDRYRVAADGKILERAIGDKDIAIEACEGGGTAEVEVRGERARAACLDDARIVELTQLASRCEQLFGGPQDLEWAVANGRLHLLQSRPVTTSAQR
jgi:pyruvate,water dikinase